jgi:catechol 2,3-dioxygenase
MMKARRIGHVMLNVCDLARAERFYTGVLGFEVVTRLERPRCVFLSLGEQHHDIALCELAGLAERKTGAADTLNHMALQLEDRPALERAYAELEQHGVAIGQAVDHGTTNSIYFEDPEGNRLELYCDVGTDGLARARTRTVRDAAEFPPLSVNGRTWPEV